METMRAERTEIIEGLNVFRALEAWGATLYAAWAANEPDARLRTGHLIIAEREANHARLLAERIRALGGEPGPACVDTVLAEQLAELRQLKGFVAQLDGLQQVTERDSVRLAGCRQALDRGRAAAAASDPATHAFLLQLYSEEKVSAGWYRQTYGEMTGRHPPSDASPRSQRRAGHAPGIERRRQRRRTGRVRRRGLTDLPGLPKPRLCPAIHMHQSRTGCWVAGCWVVGVAGVASSGPTTQQPNNQQPCG